MASIEDTKSRMLFHKIIKEKEIIDLECEDYKKFVREKLLNIININTHSDNIRTYQIAYYYYNYLVKVVKENIKEVKYLLAFFKKYNLLGFDPFDIDITFKYADNLTQQDIYAAYFKELAYVNGEVADKDKKLKPSIFEKIDENFQINYPPLIDNYEESLKSTEEEIAYINFIIDRENGLYKILEDALSKYDNKRFIIEYNPLKVNFKFIQEFCDKYGITVKKIEITEEVHKDYLSSIVSIKSNVPIFQDVRYLFTCFFFELQQIEHFSKSKEELWEEYKNFVINNQEWLKRKRTK